MLWRAITGMMLILGIIPLAEAMDPKPSAEQLVLQLSHPQFRIREQASKTLQQLGAEALPALNKATRSSNPEMVQRATDLIHTIEIQVAQMPKRITLRSDTYTVEQVLAQITQQTTYPIKFQNKQNPTIRLSWDKISFWEAIEALSQQTGGQLEWISHQDGYHWKSGPSKGVKTCLIGPFRVVPKNISLQSLVDLKELSPKQESMHLGFSVEAEPRLPFAILAAPRLTKAVDDTDKSLLLDEKEDKKRTINSYANLNNQRLEEQDFVLLKRANRQANRLKRIQGTLLVEVLVHSRPEIVLDLSKQVRGQILWKDGTDVRLGVEAVEEATDGYRLTFQVQRTDKQLHLDNQWSETVPGKLELYDTNGNHYRNPANMNVMNLTLSDLQANMLFAFPDEDKTKIGPPARLVFHRWITTTLELPFEFQDLPLP